MPVCRPVSSLVLAAAGVVLLASGCIDEDNRCGSWEYVDGGCQKPIDAPIDSASTLDGGGHDGGFADPCQGQSECTSEASYCLKDPTKPTSPGMCTQRDCDPDGDDCPVGWKCWNAPAAVPFLGYPTLCMPLEQWAGLPQPQ